MKDVGEEFLIRVSWSSTPDHQIRRGEVMADVGLNAPSSPLTSAEMQRITFAAKMETLRCLHERRTLLQGLVSSRKHPAEMSSGQLLDELRGSNPSRRRSLTVEHLRANIETDRKRALRLEAVALAAVECEERADWRALSAAIRELDPTDLPDQPRAPRPVQET
jgi:hypothetical protein